MAKWYEASKVGIIRSMVECSLKDFPPSKDENETAAAFWTRVEKAGRLVEAMDLYDECAKEEAEWIHKPRETKKMFAERIEREGRQAEVDSARNELSASGFTLREIHGKLVYSFQPLDGTRTRPWETPDPWEAGRLFRKKEDQDRLLAEANPDDYEDEPSAEWLVDCAKRRREERVALANARQRARELKVAATAAEAKLAEAKAKEAAAQANGQKKTKSQKKAGNDEDEPKIHGKWGRGENSVRLIRKQVGAGQKLASLPPLSPDFFFPAHFTAMKIP
jgi:hypothetical protein